MFKKFQVTDVKPHFNEIWLTKLHQRTSKTLRNTEHKNDMVSFTFQKYSSFFFNMYHTNLQLFLTEKLCHLLHSNTVTAQLLPKGVEGA